MSEVHTGAQALKSLLRTLSEISNDTCGPDEFVPDAPDSRDYVSMVALVRASIAANLSCATPAHAEGYLRAP